MKVKKFCNINNFILKKNEFENTKFNYKYTLY